MGSFICFLSYRCDSQAQRIEVIHPRSSPKALQPESCLTLEHSALNEAFLLYSELFVGWSVLHVFFYSLLWVFFSRFIYLKVRELGNRELLHPLVNSPDG